MKRVMLAVFAAIAVSGLVRADFVNPDPGVREKEAYSIVSNQVVGATHVVYVDPYRTNSYTADGGILTPYQTVSAACAGIGDATNLAAYNDAALRYWEIRLAPAVYEEDVTLPWRPIVLLDMSSAVISGTVTRTIPSQAPAWPRNPDPLDSVLMIRGASLRSAYTLDSQYAVHGIDGDLVISAAEPVQDRKHVVHIIHAGVSGTVRWEGGSTNIGWSARAIGQLFLEHAQVGRVESTQEWDRVSMWAHQWSGGHAGGGLPGSGLGPLVGKILPYNLSSTVVNGMELWGLSSVFDSVTNLWRDLIFETAIGTNAVTYDVTNFHQRVRCDTGTYRSWASAVAAGYRGTLDLGSRMSIDDQDVTAEGNAAALGVVSNLVRDLTTKVVTTNMFAHTGTLLSTNIAVGKTTSPVLVSRFALWEGSLDDTNALDEYVQVTLYGGSRSPAAGRYRHNPDPIADRPRVVRYTVTATPGSGTNILHVADASSFPTNCAVALDNVIVGRVASRTATALTLEDGSTVAGGSASSAVSRVVEVFSRVLENDGGYVWWDASFWESLTNLLLRVECEAY